MSVEAISNGGGRGYSRRSRLLAWVWPDPREEDGRGRDAWLAGLLGWLWPSALHDERFGRRHGLMARLFGWAWPRKIDGAMARFWRKSWLWAWMWPGRVSGPDGEICPLAPWHPAARPEICVGEPWSRKVGRHGGLVFMMFAAGAIAAPTFMSGNNGALDGGRINLFHSDPTSGDPPATDGQPGGGGQPGDEGGAGGGSGGGSGGGGPGGSEGGDPPGNPNPNPFGDPGGPGGFDGGQGGDPPGDPPGGGDPSDPGLTFLDPGPDGGDDLGTEPSLGFGGGSGGGGGGGGSGGGGTGGGGDPTNPGGEDPFTPTNPEPNPIDPPGDKPVFPQLPGPSGPTGEGGPGGGGGNGGCVVNCAFLPNEPGGPKTDDPRGPAGAVPEPATWAMMILGFGLAGYAIRRRRVTYSLS